MTKIVNFLDFATIHLTQVEYFCYGYTDLMWREQQRMKDENEDPWGPSKGVPKGPKIAEIDQNLEFFYISDNWHVRVIQTSFWHVRGITFSKMGQKDMLHTSIVHFDRSEGC